MLLTHLNSKNAGDNGSCDFLNKRCRLILAGLFAFILSACGGGSSGANSGLLTGDGGSAPTPLPLPTPDNATPRPQPVLTPTPVPPPTPVPTPTPEAALVKPVVSLNYTPQDVLFISWTETEAGEHRVLYWRDEESRPLTINVASDDIQGALRRTASFVPQQAGTYRVVVEAYDAMGNSLFSDPVSMAVSP